MFRMHLDKSLESQPMLFYDGIEFAALAPATRDASSHSVSEYGNPNDEAMDEGPQDGTHAEQLMPVAPFDPLTCYKKQWGARPSPEQQRATAFRRAVAPLAAELGPRLRKRSLSCPELIPEEGSDED